MEKIDQVTKKYLQLNFDNNSRNKIIKEDNIITLPTSEDKGGNHLNNPA